MNSFNYNVLYVNKIVKFCNLKSLTLVVVNPPFGRTFLESIPFDCKIMFDSYISSIIEKYKNVIYFDYSDDERFKDTDFFNANHLSDEGSLKFTSILIDEIKAIN